MNTWVKILFDPLYISHYILSCMLNIIVYSIGSPTWIVKPGNPVVVPLEPPNQALNPSIKNKVAITLQSKDDFTPCITVDGYTNCLTMKDSKMILATTLHPTPLMAGNVILVMELATGFIHLNQRVSILLLI